MALSGTNSSTMTAAITPTNATRPTLTWTAVPGTGSVALSGAANLTRTVAGVSAGTATVNVTCLDGVTAAATVNVSHVPVTSVTLPATLEADLNGTTTITATVNPANAENRALTWSSSNPAVATVAGTGTVGTVTGVAVGTATVTATSADDPTKTASCTVTVLRTIKTYVAGGFGLYINGQRDLMIPGILYGGHWLEDVAVDNDYNVWAIGIYEDAVADTEEAVYWKNDVATKLSTSHANDVYTSAESIFVAPNNDVYISGMEEFEGTGYPRGWGDVARLWKKAAAETEFTLQPLQGLDDTGADITRGMKVIVYNGDVYVFGMDYSTSNTLRPCIWKNNAKYIASGTNADTFCALDAAVRVSDGQLTVLGRDLTVENGTRRVFTVPANDLTAYTTVSPTSGGTILHVDNDDTNVYYAGWNGNNAYYWVNNGARTQLPTPSGATWAECHGIYGFEGHLYAVGVRSGGTPTYQIVKWIDGVVVTGANAITDSISPGSGYYTPTSIFVHR